MIDANTRLHIWSFEITGTKDYEEIVNLKFNYDSSKIVAALNLDWRDLMFIIFGANNGNILSSLVNK